MQSLADSLGLADPKSGSEEEHAPSLLEAADNLSAEEFSKAVLNSLEFRKYIANSLTLGDIPPGIVTRLMDYAWGSPTKKIEFEDKTPNVESLSKEQIAARIRMLHSVLDELPDEPSKSVH